jgi:hypothetical protein
MGGPQSPAPRLATMPRSWLYSLIILVVALLASMAIAAIKLI